MYIDGEQKPRVFDTTNIVIAVGLHVLLFGILWYMGVLVPEQSNETVVPIECLVVVHENLDGVDRDFVMCVQRGILHPSAEDRETVELALKSLLKKRK